MLEGRPVLIGDKVIKGNWNFLGLNSVLLCTSGPHPRVYGWLSGVLSCREFPCGGDFGLGCGWWNLGQLYISVEGPSWVPMRWRWMPLSPTSMFPSNGSISALLLLLHRRWGGEERNGNLQETAAHWSWRVLLVIFWILHGLGIVGALFGRVSVDVPCSKRQREQLKAGRDICGGLRAPWHNGYCSLNAELSVLSWCPLCLLLCWPQHFHIWVHCPDLSDSSLWDTSLPRGMRTWTETKTITGDLA